MAGLDNQQEEEEMNRYLKMLGLALVAVFALSAALASSAWAEEEETTAAHFYSHEEETVLTGEQIPLTGHELNEFKIGETSFTCPTAKVEGTVEGTKTDRTQHQLETGKEQEKVFSATQVTVHPTYGNEEKVCQIKVGETNFGKAKVDTTGCTYTFSAHTTKTTPQEEEHAKVWIECDTTGVGEEAEQHEIHITGPLGCNITVGEQGPKHGVRYSNEGLFTNETAIEVDITVKEIKYTATAACGLAGVPEEGEDATYDGGFTIKGFEDEGGGTPTEPVEGSQVGIWWEPANPTP